MTIFLIICYNSNDNMNNKKSDTLEKDFTDFENMTDQRLILGNYLREKREEANITIEEVSKEFRVSKDDLEKFEMGKEMTASNPSFARLLSFKYSKKLNVKDEQFPLLLDLAYPKLNEEYTQVLTEPNKMTFKKNVASNNKKRVIKRVFIYVVSLVFLLLLVGSLIFVLTKNVQSINSDVQNETTVLANQELVAQSIVGEALKTTIKFSHETALNGGELPTLVYDITQMENKTDYTVTVEILNDTRVTVYDANWNTLKEAEVYKKGETITYEATGDKQVNITVDQIQNIKVSVNGTDIKLADQNKQGYYLVQINNTVE